MQESVANILIQIRMIWRFRWLALSVAIVVSLLGWTVVVALPDQFEVSTKVYLDTSSMLNPLLKGLAIDSTMQEDTARLMQRTLLVRPNMESVARKTDMDLKAKTPEEFDALLARLAKNIKVTGTERDNIFVISYENSNPKLANNVVEAILNLFVERSLGKNRLDAGKTKQFIDQQISEYESRLTTAESRLKEFRQQNVGMMPQDGRNYYARIDQVTNTLSSAKLTLEEATRKRNEYRRQIKKAKPYITSGVQAPVEVKHPLDDRIAALESRIDQLLVQYTEKHPDVIASKALLKDLKAQREKDLKDNPPPAPVAPEKQPNKAYQELSLALSNSDAEVAALVARSEEYKRRLTKLRKLVDTIPRIEAELARLNRDYNINKRNYDELVKRRESLNLAEEASQTSDIVKFNILEPPRVPLVASGPNRPLFYSAVTAAGIALGAGLAWLLATLRPTIYTRDEAERLFQLPVLGSVTRIWTQGEIFRRRADVFAFSIGAVVLLAMFTTIVLVELENPLLLRQLRQYQFAEQISALLDQVT